MKPCKDCNVPFKYTSGNQRYCEGCQVVKCTQCYKEFNNKNHHDGRRKYCSAPCLSKWKKENVTPPSRKGAKLIRPVWNKGKRDWGVITTCPECETAFRIQEYRILKATQPLYCSKECRTKNNVTPENKRLRKSVQFAEWRRAVFTRDDYTCQLCGVRGTELHPDHIKQWALYPDLRFNVDNGRTLCAPCHRLTPTWGRKVAKQWSTEFQF